MFLHLSLIQFTRGASVQRRSLCRGGVSVCGGLCLGGWGVLSGGLSPEGSLSRGSLSLGGLCPGGLCLVGGTTRTVKRGRYVSHWNAFLLLFKGLKCTLKVRIVNFGIISGRTTMLQILMKCF